MPTSSTAETDAFRILGLVCRNSILGITVLTPTAVLAIPSPELVIGSVSSLSQVFAVAFATTAGAGALIAKRMGFAHKPGRAPARFPARLVTALLLVSLAFGALNVWQYRNHQAQELARLQDTLIRPAQFDGTQILDSDLKETSFGNQEKSPLALSTAEAQNLLENTDGKNAPLFFDVRETSEYRMGTLPGARHVRFPDFLQSNIPLEGKQVVLFCHNGNRSSETCAELAARGIDCRFIAGGIEKWIVEGRGFSDKKIKTLSDLRAIPEYANKDVLLSTADFEDLQANTDLQIVDTRYPGDFASGHLPGAINIPVRALPSEELKRRIAELQDKPTIAACYDRRSCFMSQVLGLEMSEAGIDFLGRYTTPWEYFVAPQPKPHVQLWLAEQKVSLWQTGVNKLAAALIRIGEQSHFVLGLLMLALLSRLLVVPIALKSERDQIISAKHADELKALKGRLKGDPARKARAVQQFYADKGLTPMRNLIALLFLPVMMLGLSATEQASRSIDASFLWIPKLGQPDGTYILPALFAVLAGTYLHWAVAKSKRQAALSWLIGAPAMFGLVFQLSAAGNIYLCISLTFLLIQRAYVTGIWGRAKRRTLVAWQRWKIRALFHGVVPLDHTDELQKCGNKAYRLSVLKNTGLPVPDGLVIRSEAIRAFSHMSKKQKEDFSNMVWRIMGQRPCAVRSSAANEDGADQSFAGVFESVLEVKQCGMRKALDEVVGSFSSARARSYDKDGAIGHDGNILVQHMIRSDYAGVLFTEDPTAPGLMMVELVKGCGDDLVSGRVTPQSMRFGRYTHAAIGDETPPIDMAPLLALGRQIEAAFGCPQDIEWAYADGAFQIVQSRDITTLTGANPTELARTQEWRRIFDAYQGADPYTVILEQDEMSEVLPRPTPLSFSLMGQLWAPGGSLDIACRHLGIGYNLPEGRPGHLVNFFGRTYVDHALKQKMALRLSNAKARQMRKRAVGSITQFRQDTIPALQEDMAVWQAIDFNALPQAQIIRSIEKLRDKLVLDVYVEAEKINILAGFAMTQAQAFAKGDADAHSRLMHPVLRHAPVSLIDACASLKGDAQRTTLMALMGHRAIFDYELSLPRYSEAPELLWPFLESATPLATNLNDDPDTVPSDPVDLAIALQDLKEQAKHEALRIVAQIRRAVLALAEKTGLFDHIFHLEMEELLSLTNANLMTHKARAQERRERGAHLAKNAPERVSLTLQECELLSASVPIHDNRHGSALGGTCVSGCQDADGRVFVVEDETATDASSFCGFEDGDVIVCHIVSPSWLPYVQRSGGVLSEVGGWLSHMAIVAREKGILMHVKCSGLDRLQTGMKVKAGTDGSIVVLEKNSLGIRKSA
ncbi:PEP/pyruvate-binding domain-containing protein [Sedimentitalea nanhaiensis]|uniref:Pyruvate phosphate dikinase, PEP/pyruvate binding domain n=1 Tax=Sedimentitalea nanhaiensis TaxID=999627 RepID=A0A1I7C4V0_9RHOB|nr:PEP/pyruvate-binding domain-containing protein [Sedimentitalea nanhaiensis]SFT94394.1 Pyruvate phosphate dikinase, PEP/pyruvate binding domain [Sedimentitalea nanhaiensis]